MKTICQCCYKDIEHDEGEGNIEDGWVCYECIEEAKLECRK